ncbi:MAG: M3 family metallopeptidase [Puniceicoccaceae bacterium]
MMSENPFLDNSFEIKWSLLSSDKVEDAMQQAIALGNAALNEIIELPDGSETFQNTFLALEDATLLVSSPWGKVDHLTSVDDNPELREAYKKALPDVTAFTASIPLNQGLYRKLKAFADSAAASKLNPVQQRFVSETIKDFEEAGANQPEDKRARLEEIAKTLAEKTKLYTDHVLDSTNAYERIVDSKEEMAGLPESLIEAARLDALKKGIGTEEDPKYRLTLQMTSYVPAMRFLDSEKIRKELFEAFAMQGHYGEYENEGLIREILTLRKEKASIMGKDNFPDLVLERRMAKNGETAHAFVEDLFEKTKEARDGDFAALKAFVSEQTGEEVETMNPWDMGYWGEKRRKALYDFDEEELRPYFPMESVMNGLFKLVEQIFDIRVEEVTEPKPEGWHPEVQLYSIHDIPTGHHLGNFYTDWFPREPKRGGAWMNYLITGKAGPDGLLSPHLGLMVGNLMPPVGDKPSLLTHRDVETIFHEFGHLLHHLLSDVQIRSLCGVNVAWDFVELPSQIMENWCWERVSLDLFARHYETGEAIPEELFKKMIAARNYGAAGMQMRQLFFGKMDLSLHLNFDPASEQNLDAFIKEATDGYEVKLSKEYPSIVRFFNHLFSDATGYASGYYSYKWAEVLDADAFTRFKSEGIMNKPTGKAFRECVLAKGNSEEPGKLFRDFMGRDPDPEALLKRLGLAQA